MRDLLIEILTEELPPKSLLRLAESLHREVMARLTLAGLSFKASKYFATPRRLSVLVHDLAAAQADTVVEKRGPALAAAFTATGEPTQACVGFARSCQTTPDKLITIKTDQGSWVGFKQAVKGQTVAELMPSLLQDALNALPIPKRMRWGSGTEEFIRPVHSMVLLYGKDIIPATFYNLKTGRQTQGHRFLSSGVFDISDAPDYAKILKKHFVIADFAERRELITEQIHVLIKEKVALDAKALLEDALLDEVTGLVEWPVALLGQFDPDFLHLPPELIISVMQNHQRYFPILDEQRNLLPYFITISNIKSKDPAAVLAGNERVLRARLNDAAFFFATDKSRVLTKRLPLLKNMVFQNKLGTLHDKAERLAKLAETLAPSFNISPTLAQQAGELAKTDLTTQLVGEFPELQGIAGFYYAQQEGLPKEIAVALKEQYLPRFAGDQLPQSALGTVLALSDRMDNLISIFGIGQKPTGDKDPFGLRRAALGLIRMVIAQKVALDLPELCQRAQYNFSVHLENKLAAREAWQFILERLQAFYQEQGITVDVINAVTALNLTDLYDIDRRIQAVNAFKKLPAASALSAANKRVSNILSKYTDAIKLNKIDPQLFEHTIEKNLAAKLSALQTQINQLAAQKQYTEVLTQLADLRDTVDHFFDEVLVMTEDQARRENRLLLLQQLRALFLQVADIALLQ